MVLAPELLQRLNELLEHYKQDKSRALERIGQTFDPYLAGQIVTLERVIADMEELVLEGVRP